MTSALPSAWLPGGVSGGYFGGVAALPAYFFEEEIVYIASKTITAAMIAACGGSYPGAPGDMTKGKVQISQGEETLPGITGAGSRVYCAANVTTTGGTSGISISIGTDANTTAYFCGLSNGSFGYDLTTVDGSTAPFSAGPGALNAGNSDLAVGANDPMSSPEGEPVFAYFAALDGQTLLSTVNGGSVVASARFDPPGLPV